MNWYKKAQENRQVTVQDMGGYKNITPVIVLRGKWLLDAGFYPKDKLSISISQNNIQLSVSDPSKESREYTQSLLKEKEEHEKQRLENKGTPIRMPK